MGTRQNDEKEALQIGARLAKIIAGLTSGLIYSADFKNAARKKATDFTRNRKMSFEEVILFMLLSMKNSTQSSSRGFFTGLGKTVSMKQQSFSEAREKINVAAFVELFKLTATAMTENLNETWRGHLIYAIDGGKIALPADSGLLERFGAVGRGAKSPAAQGSVLYDVLNDIVIDARIEPISTDERTLAKARIDAGKNFASGADKLFIFDRGYPSFELIEKLESDLFHYVTRVKKKFNADIDAQEGGDGYVWLEKDGKRVHARVIKFTLESGETETPLTNLKDDDLGEDDFRKLYFLRWPIETKFDIVKNKLQLENFSSRTEEGIGQDFFAAMYLTNVAAAAAFDAQAEIDKEREGKNNKYQYRANINELIGVLKDRLVFALMEDDTDEQAALIQKIIEEITMSVVPKRGNRSIPRNPSPRKTKFHHNRKTNC